MSFIDTLQNSFGLNSIAETTHDSSTNDNTERVEQVFAGLFTLLQANDSGEGTDSRDDTDGDSDFSASIDSIQQSLLSAVGLNLFDEDSLSQLTSLSNMQNSLLTSLQASLFNTAATTADTSTTTSLTADIGEVDTATTFLGSLEEFSNYFTGDNGLCVDDFFDSINVLNHIPIVSDVYQSQTDTNVDPVSEIIGGYAFGGPVGMMFAGVELAVESFTGKSIYNNLVDFIINDPEKESLESTVGQVTDAVVQAKSAYNFVTRTY